MIEGKALAMALGVLLAGSAPAISGCDGRAEEPATCVETQVFSGTLEQAIAQGQVPESLALVFGTYSGAAVLSSMDGPTASLRLELSHLPSGDQVVVFESQRRGGGLERLACSGHIEVEAALALEVSINGEETRDEFGPVVLASSSPEAGWSIGLDLDAPALSDLLQSNAGLSGGQIDGATGQAEVAIRVDASNDIGTSRSEGVRVSLARSMD